MPEDDDRTKVEGKLPLMRVTVVGALLILLCAYNGISDGFPRTRNATELLGKPESVWPPEGRAVRCPVTRDTTVSAVSGERNGNNGGMERLKVKGQQEFVIFDIDPAPLKGGIVTGAVLHIRSASPREAPLARVGVSTVASPWEEGTSKGYRPQIGSSCFDEAAYQRRDWAYRGSTIMDVVFGRGHTIWKFADCTLPDKGGWQACPVDPDVVAARVAGLSEGFCLYDEVGSVWSIEAGKFTYRYFPNRLLYSRESEDSSPWLEVWVDEAKSTEPGRIDSFRVVTESVPRGQALLTWRTPSESEREKTVGFSITYRKNGQDKEVPRYLIPMAGTPGEEVRMHIQDLPLAPQDLIEVTIRPVDRAGNLGRGFTGEVMFSGETETIDIPEADIEPFPFNDKLPKISNVRVSVVDLLDKIDPRTGIISPSQTEGYKGGNHLFSAERRLIRMQCARNETVAFQLNLEGAAQSISVDFEFEQGAGVETSIYEFGYVQLLGDRGNATEVAPDPLMRVRGPISIPSVCGEIRIPDQKNHSLICEVYVPHEEGAGKKRGKLTIKVGDEKLELDVALTVWNFTLPNKLSFVPEMNAYGMNPLYDEVAYYRLAHEHRTCINWLPYGWNGVPFSAPKWKGHRFEWSEWDREVGTLLDGSAFKDLPRESEPVDVFYLPFNENWPADLFLHYKPSYWADEAFDNRYTEEMENAVALFAKHCDEKKWYDTIFQLYLNNKVYFRRNFKGSSAPWIFDEPVNTQDFWALRWYGLLWKSAVYETKVQAKMWFRGDISFTEFGRDILRGIMDIEYIGDNNPQKMRMKRDEELLWGRSFFSEYGTTNRIDVANTQPVLWCISAWCKGAFGVLPWQTIGSKGAWRVGEQTAVFYPHEQGPHPSVRLKCFTRGQQDVEYLTLLCCVFEKPQYILAQWLGGSLELEGEVFKSSAGDAGTHVFEEVTPMELWRLRYRIGRALSEKAPEYRRSLVDWERPNWDLKSLPDIGYVRVAPTIERYRPVCERFRH